jgi:two-component system, sensor histidine kinase RpfC
MLNSLKNWYKNSATHCDPLELEQAIIRIMVGLVILCLVIFNYFNNSLSNQELIAFEIVFVFELLSVLLIAAIVKNTYKAVYRRLIGAWLDIGAASIFMAFTSDIGVMLVAVYLWVIFGNGFRYGKKYLYHAQILGIVGFVIATNISEYWLTHKTIGYSLIVMLVVLPLYVAKLIGRLHEAIHKEELARQKAIQASLAKTQFVANMSHEIRTPLNGIIGIGTLFKTTPLNSDQKDLLKSLESSSKLLLSLLNNVLDFTKIEERKFTIENVAFSIEEAVNDSLEIFRSQAISKGIKLGASISSELGINKTAALKGDAFVLRQVLANLLGNAIKFTHEGSVTISATVLQENNSTSTVRFEVADTGVGIASDKQHKIFDSFTQADSSTTRKFGGSGLGLTIAKHMVEEMGGKLNLQSTENVGSRFWFELELDKVIAVENEPSENAPDIAEITPIVELPNKSQSLNILVCEDESTNQKIITRLLSLPGHNVEIVINGDEMLDVLELRKFDLVITDLNMAGMSGTDALKLYRFTQPDDTTTRFILFTADATTSARDAATDAGFDAFLTKPIDAVTLFNTIEKILKLAPNTAAEWMTSALDSTSNADTDIEADASQLDVDTLKELEKIGAGDELFMHRLLRNYLADSVKLIYKIEDIAKQKQYGELYDYCHALKGNSLSVGAIQLANTTEAIGKLNPGIPSSEALKMLDKLNSDFSKLTLAIESYLTQPVKSRQKSVTANKKVG